MCKKTSINMRVTLPDIRPFLSAKINLQGKRGFVFLKISQIGINQSYILLMIIENT